ncbi:hypothetical protein F5B22DRAFT_648719 [Xylaria bambusicola]|uniref:uncharacterized protein n=1 Tax=Xylaria bambusicola TaxID=326684 RepID=UPI002008773B|nr:uncharacterized protein F5B22DRAFT_648719 [Xylaria bambusicola]KAI0509698.1 hypothetical protein F5B22DRAFT_648719 [Xylaria bambusicola]
MELPPDCARSLRNRRQVDLSGNQSQGSGLTNGTSSRHTTAHRAFPRTFPRRNRTDSGQGGGQSTTPGLLPPGFQSASRPSVARSEQNLDYFPPPNLELSQAISPTVLNGGQPVMTGVGNTSSVPSHSGGFYDQQQPALPGPSSQHPGGGQFNPLGPNATMPERRASTQNQPQLDALSLEACYSQDLGRPIQTRHSALPESFIYRDVIERSSSLVRIHPYPSYWPTMTGLCSREGYYVELRIQTHGGNDITSRLTVIDRGSGPGYGDARNIDVVWGQDNQGQLDAQLRRGSMPFPGWEMTRPQNSAYLYPGTPASGLSDQNNQGHNSRGWPPGMNQPQQLYAGNGSAFSTTQSQSSSGFVASSTTSPDFSSGYYRSQTMDAAAQ